MMDEVRTAHKVPAQVGQGRKQRHAIGQHHALERRCGKNLTAHLGTTFLIQDA
jgi:hypothetical protein